MCDELTANAARPALQPAAAAQALELPPVPNGLEVIAQEIMVKTPDGAADCFLVHPVSGASPAAIVWADILGMRASFRLMATRLAQSGYSVLVVNPYYRIATGSVAPEGADFNQPGIPELVVPLAKTLTTQQCLIDGRALVEFMDLHGSVDSGRKMAAIGYCMTGAYPLRMAADMPDRIGAAASFHGNGLVSDQDDSPQLLAAKMRAGLLIAIAENDDQAAPDTKAVLRRAFDEAKLTAEIEVYAGTMHGWCPPDSMVHNRAQAERAWHRLLNLLEANLGQRWPDEPPIKATPSSSLSA